MTSKISFFKLLKEDIRGRAWLLALLSLAGFLAYPIICLITISSEKRWIDEKVQITAEELARHLLDLEHKFNQFVGIGNSFSMIFIVIGAIVCAVSGYVYLHSKEKIDLYHSLPVARKKLFAVQFAGGSLIFVVPFVVNTFLCLLTGLVNDVLSGYSIRQYLLGMAVHLLFFLLFYNVAILAVMLTGKVLVSLMGTFVFLFYVPAVVLLFNGLAEVFYDTYSSLITMFGMNVQTYLSPFALGVAVYEGFIENKVPWIEIAAAIAITAALLALNLWVYYKRPSESAEKSMAFAMSEAVIKVLIVVPSSLACGLMFYYIGRTSADTWFVFGLIFGGIILSCIIEFIYHLDMRSLLNKRWSMGSGVLLACVIAAVFRFDLLGYDNYLPKEGALESVAVVTDGLNSHFQYEDSMSYETRDILAHSHLAKDKSIAYEAAKVSLKNSYSYKEAGVDLNMQEGENYSKVAVCYRFKNKKEVYREYTVPEQMIDQQAGDIWDSQEFKEKVLPIHYLNSSAIWRSYYRDMRESEGGMSFSQDGYAKLIDAYKQDVMEIDYKTIRTSLPIAELHFEYDISGDRGEGENYNPTFQIKSVSGFYVYPGFARTRACLEEAGYAIKDKIELADVARIVINDYRQSAEEKLDSEMFGYQEKNYNIEDPQQMQEILDNLIPGISDYRLAKGVEREIGVEIYPNEMERPGDFSWGPMYFKKDSVPSFILEHE